jgi:apolipoprotein N-acyltransferase
MMKKKHLLFLSLLSGLLMALSWPGDGLPALMFIAFIPMLYLEDYISKNRQNFHRFSVLMYSYPGFFVWNALTTWWIWNSTESGAIGALVANSFFMALVLNIYSISKKYVYGKSHGYFILPFFWMSFEYWHLNWDMSWPWLNLGNAFANYPEWVQWYECTGMFGGTLWILVVNILFYRFILLGRSGLKKEKYIWGGLSAFLLFVPLIISFVMYAGYEEEIRPVEVVVTQPNVDPYREQYNLPPIEIIDRNLNLARTVIDENTDFLVCPESSIQEAIWEHRFDDSPGLNHIKKFIQEYPQLAIFIGASTFKEYMPGEEISYTARKFRNEDGYYDAYNTVFFIDDRQNPEFYHKSKLTPAAETMPFPQYFKFLERFSIDLGGTVGSLGTDKVRKVFITQDDSLRVAAVICYESIYGEFIGRFVRNGAELIFVITNDGWWGDTPGHRQHFSFSRLRAVETRRSIARSANTGISAFINQRGDVLQESEYWVPAVLKQSMNANSNITFYSMNGDYLARIASFISVMLLLIAISMRLRNGKRYAVGSKQ